MEHSARCNCWTKRPLTTYYVVFHKGRFVWGVVKTLKTPTWEATCGSLYVSGKLPTYPSPKLILTLTSHLGQNVGLWVGVGGQFPWNFYARVWKEGSWYRIRAHFAIESRNPNFCHCYPKYRFLSQSPIPCPNFGESRFPGAFESRIPLTFPESRTVFWSNPGFQENPSRSC